VARGGVRGDPRVRMEACPGACEKAPAQRLNLATGASGSSDRHSERMCFLVRKGIVSDTLA